MRRDKDLTPEILAHLCLTKPQTFFLSCWFNMVHQASLDSYRVRVMNPENILREMVKMYEPHADEKDRRRIAEELVDIFTGDPILANDRYAVKEELLEIVKHALKGPSENHGQNGKQGAVKSSASHGFSKQSLLLQSFANELVDSLHVHYLSDCFVWLENTLEEDNLALTELQRHQLYREIERVCRNLLSVSLDHGSSLESLFQHYRGLARLSKHAVKERGAPANQLPAETIKVETGESTTSSCQHIGGADHPHPPAMPAPAVKPYKFMERFRKVRGWLTAAPKNNELVFVLNDVTKPDQFPEKIGDLRFSDSPPQDYVPSNNREKAFIRKLNTRRYVYVTIEGRDGRGAGMQAYRQIGEVLDLVRFEYDKTPVQLLPQFLLKDGDRYLLLKIPQLVPNPENQIPPKKLEEFVEHLNNMVGRKTMHSEAKDRIFSAFRLYRVGADAEIFENKLLNWWTALEYLAKGSKGASGPIGGGVESALAPTLSLAYIPKHLSAYRSIFKALAITIQSPSGDAVALADLSDAKLFEALKWGNSKAQLLPLCSEEPYLWYHLNQFMDAIAQPGTLKGLLVNHERRLRLQIQRIYRARCDVVHSGKQVVNASLLCANLEYYLKLTLDSMLMSFDKVQTLRGPHEFFERTRHRWERIIEGLSRKPNPSDELLIHSLGIEGFQ